MFLSNYFRAFQAYFSGKLSKNKDLQKGFWIFFIFIIAIWSFTGYNSSMSYGYYLYSSGTMFLGWLIAGIFTIVIAVSIVMSGGYWIDFIQDWIGGKSIKERAFGMFMIIFIYWGAAQAWDIYVNKKGIKTAAEYTTEEHMEDNSGNVDKEYTAKVDAKRAELLAIYHPYFWCGTHKKRHEVHSPKKTGNSYLANLEVSGYCKKEAFWFGAGGNGMSSEQHDKNIAAIKKKELAIDSEEGIRVTQITSAQTEYQKDIDRYGGEIGDREETHGWLIYISYGLIFLCTCYTNWYANKIGQFIKTHYPDGFGEPELQTQVQRVGSAAGTATELVEQVQQTPSATEVVVREVPQGGASLEEIEELLDSRLKKENPVPPNNTGKEYKKPEKTVSTSGKLSSEDIIRLLSEYKLHHPQGTAAQAVKDLKGTMSKSTVYKYWQNA